jgi:excisionase family DNA binding protein
LANGTHRALPARMQHDEARNARGRSLLIPDAAAALGVSRRTIYYRIQEGRLQTIRTRCGSQRVLMSSIEALRAEMLAEDGTSRSRSESSEPLQSEALTLQVQPLA